MASETPQRAPWAPKGPRGSKGAHGARRAPFPAGPGPWPRPLALGPPVRRRKNKERHYGGASQLRCDIAPLSGRGGCAATRSRIHQNLSPPKPSQNLKNKVSERQKIDFGMILKPFWHRFFIKFLILSQSAKTTQMLIFKASGRVQHPRNLFFFS